MDNKTCHKCGSALTKKQIKSCDMLIKCGTNRGECYCAKCYADIKLETKKYQPRKSRFVYKD